MPHILVTRPQPAADALVLRLEAEGFSAVAGPLAEYVTLPFDTPDLSSYGALAFTSAQAVRVFAEQGVAALPVYCVGDATAGAAAAAGFTDVRSADGDARDLVQLLSEQKNITRVLHVAGVDTAQDMTGPLAAAGIILDRLVVYKARLLDDLPPGLDEAVDTVMLFSARAAARLASLLPEGRCGSLAAVCLSPRVATGLGPAPWKSVHIANKPNLESMIEVLRSLI